MREQAGWPALLIQYFFDSMIQDVYSVMIVSDITILSVSNIDNVTMLK